MNLTELAGRLDTDKARIAGYLRNYESQFEPLRDREIRLLELGVYRGDSLRLWRDYFARGVVVGLDFHGLPVEDPSGRIRVYKGAQQDLVLLDRIAAENAPEGFDIIIDDCAHVGVLARASFWHLFDHHLKSGGLYVIEDWGTGYWPGWVDGAAHHGSHGRYSRVFHRISNTAWRIQTSPWSRFLWPLLPLVRQVKAFAIRRQFRSHDYGMVGFVKELVDEIGAADMTHPEFGVGPTRTSKIRGMHVSRSQLFVTRE